MRASCRCGALRFRVTTSDKEQADPTQPAEEFEVSLKRHHKKLGAKLRAIAAAIEVYGPQLGGGLIELCHDHKGLWEKCTIFNGFLGRELFGFVGEQNRVVLLHGYVKRVGQPASPPDLNQASEYWRDYQHTHKISPEVLEQEEQS
jgi:hypothetical protein